MTTTYMSHVITPTPYIQAQVMYRWLTFINDFPLVDFSGVNWEGSTVYVGSTGYNNTAAPTHFYDASGSFTGLTGNYIAIKDSTNPTNSLVARILSVSSANEIVLELSSVFTVTATDLSYVVFDPVVSPVAAADFFVLQNPAVTGPSWQVHCEVTATPELKWTLGFIGGWDVGLGAWTLSTSASYYSYSTTNFTFCVTDPQSGYLYMWSDHDGSGAGSSKNALWVGSLSPFHSPSELGVPKDLSYSAIFGSGTSGVASNLSRDTTVSDNFVVGESLGSSGLPVTMYMAQKRFLSSGADSMSIPNAANLRSALVDDYDAIAISSPASDIRGRVSGVRLLNDAAPNRVSVNTNFTYVLGNGIGATWNGKAPNSP